MIKVFLLCSGLGNVQRGYESFFQECFSVLSQESSLDVTLFKGGGNSQEKSINLWNMPRSSWMAVKLGNLVKNLSEFLKKGDYFLKQEGYFIEEASFVFSLLPFIQSQKPDVIYFSDDGLGYLLWHWRRLTKQNYKLLFRNGGPFSPPFTRWNHVQHLTPTSFQNTLNYQEPAAKHTLLPSGFNIPSELQMLSAQEREVLRNRLGLPKEKPLILSVAAINSFHKRVDYIIHEVATLPEPRPFLLLLGQKEKESDKLIQLGNQLLGSDNFQIRTVPRNQVDDYYRIADVFVLASLREAFGRVFVEAMSYGLPCLAHDYDIPRYVLGKEGYFANFELSGTLANLITKVLSESLDKHKRLGYHRSVYDRFSWEQLRRAYVDMIERCAVGS
ncbi:glycosyltransferase family 4 protein [Planktothrix sp. FACHB-1355]|uniref:Glycosyltransferase family 4 protein n=1 Tax=Aerosakkonema funiforme FACHB-1375 TaxID=2949571 RepID=A0A926VKP1_9CYAN|nr:MULTISPECIES: glycosyltransferase family 4 protein [Oscillatoriales]MBD2184527.1 glycosyltransferase family 4 protein [Aerosakkonema funiforme FACHB-1375]MBD3561173.1 glycosyltransferase family 4 protein [Planktothrix sp. FACHB-1355]